MFFGNITTGLHSRLSQHKKRLSFVLKKRKRSECFSLCNMVTASTYGPQTHYDSTELSTLPILIFIKDMKELKVNREPVNESNDGGKNLRKLVFKPVSYVP